MIRLSKVQQTNRKKSSGNGQYFRRRLSCPICNFERLIDTGQNTKSQTYQVGDSAYLNADYYQKCSKCKSVIGITKIE